jgi:hypothetical protein
MRIKLVVLIPLLGLLGFFALGGLGYLFFTGGDPSSDDSRGAVGVPRPDGEALPRVEKGAREALGDITLVGKFALGSGCAAEERLTVYALSRSATIDEVLGAEATDELILGRSAVDPGGEFAITLPRRDRPLHLLTAGQFLHDRTSKGVRPHRPGGKPIVLEPRCGGALQGRVVLPTDLSPEGIPVRLSSVIRGIVGSSRRTDRMVKTGPDGGFAFDALPVPGPYEIQVLPEELAATSLDAPSLVAGQVTELELHLSTGGSVEGRVVDDAGEAIAGATVSALVSAPRGRSDYGHRETETDEKGAFSLDHLPAETITIRADREGLLQSPMHHVEIGEKKQVTGVELVLRRGGTIAGVLHWPDGEPAVELGVQVVFDAATRFGGLGGTVGANRGADGEANTDSSGRFEITGLGTGPFCLTAHARPDETSWSGGGESGDRPWSVRVEGIEPSGTPLELTLAPPTILHGRVTDPEGAAVTRFTIHAVLLMQTNLGALAREQRDLDFDDEEGRFELDDLESGPWDLYAVADGFGVSPPIRLQLPAQAETPIEIGLAPAGTVSGLVSAPDGAPVGGAEIRIDEGGPEWMPDASGGPKRPGATSRDDGTFEIEGLSSGTIQLFARASGFTRGPAVTIDVEPGKLTTGIALELRRGGTLTGEIFGVGGKPTGRAIVQLISLEDFDVVHLQSDPDGTFLVRHLDPGGWQVLVLPNQVRLEELSTREGESRGAMISELKNELVEVVDGESTHIVFGAPPDDPVRVTGTVTHGGEAVGRATIVFAKEGREVMRHLRRAGLDAEGRFSTTLDGGGTYVVIVRRALGGPGQRATLELPMEIPEVDEHTLDIVLPGGRISGRAVGPDGSPAAGVRLSLMPGGTTSSARFEDPRSVDAITDQDGAFDLDALPEGEYVLAIGGMKAAGLFRGQNRHTSFGRKVQALHLSEDEWIENIEVELSPPGTARLRVLDEQGRPASGATIFARNRDGILLESIALARTDDSGYCEYAGLTAGTYTFCARKGDHASPAGEVAEVTEGRTQEVTLHLVESTFLWIRLLDGQRKPTRADLRIIDSRGHEVQGMLSLEGLTGVLREHGFSTSERRFGPFPPGRYEIVARRGDDTVERRVTLTGRKDRKQTLRFGN